MPNTLHNLTSRLRAEKDVEWFQYPAEISIYGGGARDHLYKKMIETRKINQYVYIQII